MPPVPKPHRLITGLWVERLGARPERARVLAIEPADFHGLRGVVWRVRVGLADGSHVDGFCHSDGRVWFTNPRVRALAGPGGTEPVAS